jgi:hypothetical protein
MGGEFSVAFNTPSMFICVIGFHNTSISSTNSEDEVSESVGNE